MPAPIPVAIVAVACVGSATAGARAAEQPRTVPAEPLSVTVEGGASCLDAADLRRGIEATLGLAGAPPPSPARVAVTARAEGNARTVRVEVTVPEAGRRSRVLALDDPRCTEVRDAVVLVAALLADELWARAEPLRIAPSAPPADDAPHPRRQAPRPVPPPRSGGLRAVEASVAAVLSVRDVAPWAAGVSATYALHAPRRTTVRLGVVVWPLARAVDDGGRGARFTAFEAGAWASLRAVDRPAVALGPAAGVRGGLVATGGVGLDRTEAALRPRANVDATLDVAARLRGPLWLDAGVGLTVPLVRDRFTFDTAGGTAVAHRPAPVAFLARLGLALRAPGARR